MTAVQESVFTLPIGWTRAKLGEIAEIVLGQSPPSSTYNEDRVGLPFYQGKLEFGKVYPTPVKWCSKPKKTAEKGDVLISVRAPVGPTNICPEKSCIGRGLAAIRGLGGVNSSFVLYLMRTFENVIAGKGTGTTFSAISGDQLRQFEIPLPPLNEQHRIASKVEELFSCLDAGVESLLKVKTLLKRYRQAVLKYAFEGKLTEEWRKTHKDQKEPAQELLERIKQQRKKAEFGKYEEFPSIDPSGLSNLPDDWVWTRVGEISDTVHYGYTASAVAEPVGPKMLRITDIQENNVNWEVVPYCRISEDKKHRYLLENGDLVFARTGATVGKSFLIKGRIPEAVFASYLIRIKLVSGIRKEFVSHFFQSPSYWMQIRQEQVGIGQPNVNSRTLSRIVLPFPPIMEQHKIVEEIDDRLTITDEIGKTLQKSLTQAERLRQSILKEAFQGNLVPQNPTDEPAEKFLARMREEKRKPKTAIENNVNRRGLIRYVK